VRELVLPNARACILAVALLMSGLAQPAAAFDDAALARQAYAGIILPGYARLDDAARAFVGKTEALCKAPSQAALDGARAAARATLLAWGRIEPLRFGPVMQKQRFDRLLFHPDQHRIVAKQTAKLLAKRDDADIEAGKLAGASVAVQGFGAVDAALYGHGSDTLAGGAGEASFRCRYVHALAVDIAQIAAETHAEWGGDYGRTWLAPGAGNKTYLSPKETTQALYRAYATEIEVLRGQRLAPTLNGAVNGAAPLLPHSGLSLPFILAAVEGERDILGPSGFGAADLASTDTERSAIAILGSVVTDLGFALRSGEAAVAMAPNPLADDKARARLAPMLLALKNAEETGRAALGDLTGQSLGFNSLDGD
jgi:predicted lipoprotein